jgi:hypothetical protein
MEIKILHQLDVFINKLSILNPKRENVAIEIVLSYDIYSILVKELHAINRAEAFIANQTHIEYVSCVGDKVKIFCKEMQEEHIKRKLNKCFDILKQ